MADFSAICTGLFWKWFTVSVFFFVEFIEYRKICAMVELHIICVDSFGCADVLNINGEMEEVI